MSFVAFDFETANQYRNSACSLGLVRMDEEGRVLSKWYSLICPKVPYFDPRCTAVHHLDSFEVMKAPHFDALWPEIEAFIGDDILVAHNAAFDRSVLRATAEAYGITLPEYEIQDTLRMARASWHHLPNHRLGTLVDYLGFEYDAHNALSDAYACGKVYIALSKELQKLTF
jgi:DNA polymerase III, epsilon subunit and related 3''-5'' exonucleases